MSAIQIEFWAHIILACSCFCFILAVWPLSSVMREERTYYYNYYKNVLYFFPREIFTSRKRKDSYLACNAFDVNLFASLPSFRQEASGGGTLSSTLWRRESLNVLSSTASADCNNEIA